MAREQFDVIVVGGGIVGLATALALTDATPGRTVAVVEKEPGWGAHQTGHNSGVIHAGVYYKPGSAKARLCTAGNRSMVAFCEANDVRHAVTGKLVVATEAAEVPLLEELERRTAANGVAVRRIGPDEAREFEPNVRCVDALHVPDTGVVDYRDVTAAMVRLLDARGTTLISGSEVAGIETHAAGKVVRTATEELSGRYLVSCAGLQSDRVARLDGVAMSARILPFRGEYYELVPERSSLVQGLIYPVPNPAFPFLGVHFTKGIEGHVHAGPNAVPALKREGYERSDVDLRDMADMFGFAGTWRLGRRYYGEAAREVVRSFSKRIFTRALQRLVPDVQMDDLVPAPAGVRAQAVGVDGSLADDFLFVRGHRSLHVGNAPSPAATASLEIGRQIAAELPAEL